MPSVSEIFNERKILENCQLTPNWTLSTSDPHNSWYIFGNSIYGNVFSKICVEIKYYTNFQGNAQNTGGCPCMTSMTSTFWPPLFIRCFNSVPSVPIVWNHIWLKPKNGRSLYYLSLTTFENSIENWYIISRYLSLFELNKATKTVKIKKSVPLCPIVLVKIMVHLVQ